MFRLVIVDDEYIVVEGIKAIISRKHLPFDVVGSAMDGCSALEVITQTAPDVVITDIRIPGMDGLSLIEACQKSCSHISYIIISGYADFLYAKRALDLGVVDYLEKPITIDKLTSALRRIENRRRLTNPAETMLDRLIDDAIDYDPERVACSFRKLLVVYHEQFPQYKQYAKKLFAAMATLAELSNERLPSDMMIHIQFSEVEHLTSFEEMDVFAQNLLARVTSVMQGNLSGVERTLVGKVLQFIVENYQRDIGLNEVAESVQLNPAYLSLLFKKEVGVSFIRYLSDFRIKKAKELLQTGKRVSEVSLLVGYPDYRYFCSIFKKVTGRTPTEFMKSVGTGEA